MGTIYIEDIAGANLNGDLVCTKCFEENWRTELKQDDYILRSVIENDDESLFFCDKCGEQL